MLSIIMRILRSNAAEDVSDKTIENDSLVGMHIGKTSDFVTQLIDLILQRNVGLSQIGDFPKQTLLSCEIKQRKLTR